MLKPKNASNLSAIRHAVIGLSAVLLVTWLAFVLRLNMAAAGFLQLLVVVGIALRSGFWYASVASILANLCLNYFFIKPIFTFYVPETQDWVALIVFEAVALVVTRLSVHARLQTQMAVTHQAELEKLYQVARGLLSIDPHGNQETAILTPIQELFSLDAIALFDGPNAQQTLLGINAPELLPATREAYLGNNNKDGGYPGEPWVRVLSLGARPIGALGLCGENITARTMNAIASLASIALARIHSLERETRAQAERRSEEFRTTVLDALAHEYKTPLTVIKTSTSGLLEMGRLDEMSKELITLIDSETDRLSGLTNHLLQTARLDKTDLRIRPERIDVEELVHDLIGARSGEASLIQIEGPETPVRIRADRELVHTALNQYLDNACKYSDPGSVIVVSIETLPGVVRISVQNAGEPILPEERERIFERFHRSPGSSHRASGTGVGLSVTKKVAAIHNGRVWVASDNVHSNTFYLELPRLLGDER